MTEPSTSALALARLRAAGAVPRPPAAATVTSWENAATRAGRVLQTVSRPGQSPLLGLGWVEGSEPVAGPDTGVERSKPSPVVALTFAAALRACWVDRSEHPFPGETTTEETVLCALASLGPLSPGAIEGGAGAERHQKGALRRLHHAGFLTLTEDSVALGPRVALWSHPQIAALRVVYDQLPVTTNTQGGGA